MLILPDQVTLAPKEAEKIRAYLKNGGKLYSAAARHGSEKTGFALEELGIKYLGKNPYAPAYLRSAENFCGSRR